MTREGGGEVVKNENLFQRKENPPHTDALKRRYKKGGRLLWYV